MVICIDPQVTITILKGFIHKYDKIVFKKNRNYIETILLRDSGFEAASEEPVSSEPQHSYGKEVCFTRCPLLGGIHNVDS